ncbi:unnamed protein product [Bathycoccus prasinos]
MTTTAQKNAKAGGATGKNRSSMVVVHLRARPPRCKKDERGEGCVLVTSEGPRGSVLVKCRDRRMPSSGGGGRGRQQEQQQQQQQQQHASFQFTGNVLREATNDEVFEAVAKEAVEAATDGFNATILAYGQTGSGKTYTMGSGDGSYENRGIIPRALTMVFEKLAVGRSVVGRAKDKVSVSFVEIYNENLIDLLSSHEDPKNAPACVISDAGPDSGVFIRGLTTKEVSSEDEALALWFEGDAQRAIGSHAMNDRSSRSHAVFTLNIETASFKSTETSSLSSATLHRSKIHLVDLAGSERLRKTKSTGTVMREATFINKSLSVLERVIISLGERNQSNRVDHVPYRSSKLTHLLRDALGGNCKTVMIAHVSSDYQHAEETLTTCQLAKRMMRVENNAKLNECVETPSEKLTRLEREIKKLRAELKLLKSNAAASKKNGSVDNDEKHQRREEEEEEDETNTAQPSVVQEEEEEEEEVCCATDAVSEDDASISSLGSYESARLNDEARAYDEFKQTNGREKVRELSNGKAASRACKHRVRALSERVNDIKREMDATEKEYERRRKERSEAGTKTGTSSSYGSTRRETGSQEREENENPDVVANLVVDEVLAALRHDIETQTTGAENVAGEEEKEEESEETSNEKQDRDDEKGEEEEEEEEEEETLHSLLRPLKASYRLAFDQLLSAKDSLNAAELVVGDLSAKLHDAFVSFWAEKKTNANSSSSSTAPPPPTPSRQNASRSSSPFSSPSGRDKEPSSSAPPLHPPSASSSQKGLFYAQLTEQWSSSSSASSSSNQPTVSNSTRIRLSI